MPQDQHIIVNKSMLCMIDKTAKDAYMPLTGVHTELLLALASYCFQYTNLCLIRLAHILPETKMNVYYRV
jgi:hypothetical protein